MMYLISVGVPADLMVHTQLSLQQSFAVLRLCYDGVRARHSETDSDRWRRRMNVMV